jgi:rubrerythrin
MEARMAEQDHQFELGKISSMKGMSAQEMMAAQIAQVAKVAGADAVGSIAKSVGDTASAQEKEALLREMLDRQEKSADKLAQAQKEAMETIVRTNQDLAKMNTAVSSAATEGYKDAAKIAQTTNEKSMESMAKVATAAAGRKPGRDEGGPEVKVSECISCGFAFEGKKKFCPQCGEKQEKLD